MIHPFGVILWHSERWHATLGNEKTRRAESVSRVVRDAMRGGASYHLLPGESEFPPTKLTRGSR